jgi:DNA-binding transcriptional ArsR family regulator
MAYALAMDALGDGRRREILERLRRGPLAVGELAKELPVSRPAVSQHLRVLKEAGLVTERRNGTRHLYRVNTDGLAEVRDYLESFWSDVLAAFEAAAEAEAEKERE